MEMETCNHLIVSFSDNIDREGLQRSYKTFFRNLNYDGIKSITINSSMTYHKMMNDLLERESIYKYIILELFPNLTMLNMGNADILLTKSNLNYIKTSSTIQIVSCTKKHANGIILYVYHKTYPEKSFIQSHLCNTVIFVCDHNDNAELNEYCDTAIIQRRYRRISPAEFFNIDMAMVY